MNILDWNSLDPARQAAALERPKLLRDAKLLAEVERIVRRVRKDGDAALLAYAKRFDGVAPAVLCRFPGAESPMRTIGC